MNTKIKKQSREFSRTEMYKMCEDTSTSVQDAEGTVFSLDGYILYETTDADGRPVEVLAIKTEDGDVFSTVSETFKRNFFKILDYMDGSDESFDILITSGTSKNGRKYVSCTIN